MKKLIPFLIAGVLVSGVFGCQESANTNSENPTSSNEASSIPAKPASETTQTTDKSTETTTEATTKTTDATTKAAGDLKTEVSKKLQSALPGNKLEVENKDGEITLKGAAASQDELTKAEKLTKEVQGVKTVKVEAKVTPTQKP